MCLFQEADFACGPFDITDKRIKLVDFSYPLGFEKCTILSAKQIEERGNDLCYFENVHFSIWVCIVMTFILIVIQNTVINKTFIDNLFHAYRIMIRAGNKYIKLMIYFHFTQIYIRKLIQKPKLFSKDINLFNNSNDLCI